VAQAQSMAGRRVLITGAARGIGAETARQVVRAGGRVGLVGLEPQELERVATELGPSAVWAEADVTDWDQLEAAVGGVVGELGGLDAVVANAGIGAGGPIHLMDRDMFERVLEVNLIGVWRTVRVCLPHVMATRGYVLIITSLAAISAAPLMGAYCTSKRGAEAFGDVLRIEMAPHGVDVGVAYFSWLDTDMVRAAAQQRTFNELRDKLPAPMRRTSPVSAAGVAIVDGIATRARYVMVPGWIRMLKWTRGVGTRAREVLTRRQAARAEELFVADLGEDGQMMGGPGAQAAWDAGRARERAKAGAGSEA